MTYVNVRDSEDGSFMVWPHPEDPAEIEWALRYGEPSRANLLIAASYINAYRHLFEMSQRLRNRRIREVKSAAKVTA